MEGEREREGGVVLKQTQDVHGDYTQTMLTYVYMFTLTTYSVYTYTMTNIMILYMI